MEGNLLELVSGKALELALGIVKIGWWNTGLSMKKGWALKTIPIAQFHQVAFKSECRLP